MSQLPTLTLKSGKPSPHNGYTTVTATLHIPESGLTLTARTTGWGYNREAAVLIDLMSQLSCPNDGLHRNTESMTTQLLNWIALGNIHPRPTLPVLFKRATYRMDNTSEIVALFPTLPATYGSILCYSHIGQHSECDYAFATGHGSATIRNALPTEYLPLLNELRSIYEAEPDAYRLEVKTQLKHEDLLKMWKATACK